MPKQMTLCILTHNRVAETVQLIDSIKEFKDIELEISIADQESDSSSRKFFHEIADSFSEVSDRDLWEYGFGAAKQRAVDGASNDWIIYGDPGEVWHENLGHRGGLSSAIDFHHGDIFAYRVFRGEPELVRKIVAGEESGERLTDDNGRVFRKSIMKMMDTYTRPLFIRQRQICGHIGLDSVTQLLGSSTLAQPLMTQYLPSARESSIGISSIR